MRRLTITVLTVLLGLLITPAAGAHYTGVAPVGPPGQWHGGWLTAPLAEAPEVDAARAAAAAYWATVPAAPSMGQACGTPPEVRVVDTTRELRRQGRPAQAGWGTPCTPVDHSVWLEAWWIESWAGPQNASAARGRAYCVGIAHEYGHALDVGGSGDDHLFPDPAGVMAGNRDGATVLACADAFPDTPSSTASGTDAESAASTAGTVTVRQARHAARQRLGRRYRLRVKARTASRVVIVARRRARDGGRRQVLAMTRPVAGGPLRVTSRT